jgi:hypothetical protein
VARKNVPIGKGNVSILARFKTDDDGTIFARCPRKGDYERGGKMLYFREGRLVYDDSREDPVVPGEYCDNQWHSVAVVYRGAEVFVYVDGEEKLREDRYTTGDVSGHVFQIGAGTRDIGANFYGEISEVLYYNEPLNEAAIRAFAKGRKPSAAPVLEWRP